MSDSGHPFPEVSHLTAGHNAEQRLSAMYAPRGEDVPQYLYHLRKHVPIEMLLNEKATSNSMLGAHCGVVCCPLKPSRPRLCGLVHLPPDKSSTPLLPTTPLRSTIHALVSTPNCSSGIILS